MMYAKHLAGLAAAAACAVAAPTAAHAKAIVHYTLDEGSGTAVDLIGGVNMNPINSTAAEYGLAYGQAGVPAGTYGPITITAGQSANFATSIAGDSRFPGFASMTNTTANNALNTLNGPFTITAWVNPETLTTIGRVLASQSITNGSGQKTGWGFGVLTSGRMRFTTYGVKDFDTTTGATVAVGQWQHIASTYSVTSGTATINFYLNGTLAQSITGGPFQATNPTAVFGLFASGGGTETFAGSIDDVWVYNTALTQTEIRQAATGVEVISVPEPTTAGVAGLAVAGLLARRRRRTAPAMT